MPLTLPNGYRVRPQEIEYQSILARGPGGQHVNKTASAVQLRFDIHASSLPEAWCLRLLQSGDRRISKDGVLVIKADRFRCRQRNRQDALERLGTLLAAATQTRKSRRPTRPSRAARQRRLDAKAHRSRTKAARGRVI